MSEGIGCAISAGSGDINPSWRPNNDGLTKEWSEEDHGY